MLHMLISAMLAAAAISTACVIPPGTLSNTITTGFGILVQNPAFPIIHDRYMNLDAAGGGDQHLFLDPIGARTSNLVLNQGSLAQGVIHAVINGEVRLPIFPTL
jgi:kremen protein